jgi:phytoene dehydrogenase-like protein
VLVLEAEDTPGGGVRSAALTRPGFVHDRCSAIHPFGLASSFFRSLPLERYGLSWVHPPLPLAHPLDGGTAAVFHQSLDDTARGLGSDGAAYRRLMEPCVEAWPELVEELLQPLLHLPRHPWKLASFGLKAVRSARGLARRRFRETEARALFAGMAAHAVLPLGEPASASFGLMLGMLGHAVGWPMPRGGAQSLADALVACLRDLGGEIVTGHRVRDLAALPPARAVLLDVTPRQFVALAGSRTPDRYRRRLEQFRYGWGVYKVDYALDGPIPWTAEPCTRAGTVHLGGTFEEVAEAERAVQRGQHPERPFVLLAQPSLFDPSRAPSGQHTAWAYCHVPAGTTFDMTARIEGQIERFAPGFGARILERHVSTPADLERSNANLVGGSINGGRMGLWQLLARPTFGFTPYRTPLPGVYLCSSSTPPGGGVHGMCGYHAAQTVLHDEG